MTPNPNVAWTTNADNPCTTPTYDGSGQGMHPSVYDAGAGETWNGHRYWMAMTPYPNNDSTKENPSILELRRMQMVTEVGQENNTTTVIMLPSEFISFSRSLKKVIDMKDRLKRNSNKGPVLFEKVQEGS